MVPFVMRVISDPVLDKKESGLWDEIVIVAKVSDRGHVLYLLFTGWCIYWKHSEPSWRRLRLTRPKDLGKTWLLRLCNIFMIPPWKSTFYGLYPLPPPPYPWHSVASIAPENHVILQKNLSNLPSPTPPPVINCDESLKNYFSTFHFVQTILHVHELWNGGKPMDAMKACIELTGMVDFEKSLGAAPKPSTPYTLMSRDYALFLNILQQLPSSWWEKWISFDCREKVSPCWQDNVYERLASHPNP